MLLIDNTKSEYVGPVLFLIPNRFESYYSQIEKKNLIYAGKKFNIRRKSVFWLSKYFKEAEFRETFGEYIYRRLSNYHKLYNPSLLLVFLNFNKPLFLFSKKHVTFYWTSSTKTSLYKFFLFYQSFITQTKPIALTLLNHNTSKISNITYSFPKKQLFVSINSNSKSIVMSSGIIRRALELTTKCSKKQNNVSIATIKFSLIFLYDAYNNCPILVNIIRGSLFLSRILSFFYIYKLNNNVLYILYNPKINFSPFFNKRKADVKRRIAKRKKYFCD